MKKLTLFLLLAITGFLLCLGAAELHPESFEIDGFKLNGSFRDAQSNNGAPDQMTAELDGLGYKASAYNGCKLAVYGNTNVVVSEDLIVGIQGKRLRFSTENLLGKGDKLSDSLDSLNRIFGQPKEQTGPSSFPPFEVFTVWETDNLRIELISIDNVVSEVQAFTRMSTKE